MRWRHREEHQQRNPPQSSHYSINYFTKWSSCVPGSQIIYTWIYFFCWQQSWIFNQATSLNLKISVRNNSSIQRGSLLEVQINVLHVITSRNNLGKLENTVLFFLRSVSIQIHAWISSLPAHWRELIHQKDSLQCPGESPALDQLQLRWKIVVIRWYRNRSKTSELTLHLFTGANLKYQIYEILLQNKSQSFPVCDAITASCQPFDLATRTSSTGCATGYNWSNRITEFTSIYRRGL